ncbi:MAG: MFS transporter [Planctomycetes bacterium]|nr:MFS transporter [Planctomycetota bacterium]
MGPSPVTPPPILLLQFLNLLVGFASYLNVTLANQVWNGADWNASQIGCALTLSSLCYAVPVSLGGWLADRWGRARTSFLGAAVGAVACIVAWSATSPDVIVGATMATMLGAAFFFPGCAGLFSDSEGAAPGRAPMALHTKVSRYNLGWSFGNLAGFLASGVLAHQSAEVGYLCSTAAFLIACAILVRWLRLQPQPPLRQGDRSAHPSLPILTWMCRGSLLFACVVGLALIALIERAVPRAAGVDPHAVAAVALSCYSAGYVAMFLLLGSWSGWIMRPWRLWAIQLCLVAGSVGVYLLGHASSPSIIALGVCGALLGLGYGATYTGSIYYSMRLPEGAARAVSLHETFLGVGNTLGPILGGLAMELVATGALVIPVPGGSDIAAPLITAFDSRMSGLALFMAVCAIACLLLQAILIPRARRMGGTIPD